MNILVIGCDQVGAALIRDLERIGHDISVVEKDPEQLKRLDAFDDYTFHGTALVGDPTAGTKSSAGYPTRICKFYTTRPTSWRPSAPPC